MINKRLRFLIVDESHINCRLIEKYLNHFGYYGVATAQSFSEMLILVEVGPVPFDLVIFNAAVVSREFDLSALLRLGRHVRHSLAYNQEVLSSSSTDTQTSMNFDFAKLPDEERIKELLEVIECGNSHLNITASPPAPNALVESKA